MLRTISYFEGLTVDIKRTLAGASIAGMIGIPALLLGAGVAAADPAPAPGPAPQQCADPANCPPPADKQDEQKKNNASSHPGIKIPEAWSREVAKNVANLPSPVEANASVPVSVGLPDLVLPDIVPDVSVPFILNPPALSIPAPQMGPINNPLNLGPPENPFKFPKIGF
jgi:hypothetical protein